MGRNTIILFFALLLAGCASPNGAASDRIEGRIVAVASTDPLPQVRVRVAMSDDDGHKWHGVSTTNSSGHFAIDALTNPLDYSSTLLQRDRTYELVAEVEGYWVHKETIDFSRKVYDVAIELKPKDYEDVGTGGGVQEEDKRLLGNGGKAPIRGG
jgi:hypothetical protein